MRLTVVHDSQGEILTLVARSPQAPPARMELQPGQHITEVEAPDDMPGTDNPQQLHERLSELMENFQIDVEGVGGTLTAKSDTSYTT